jgi:hypothetical protein
MPKMTSPITHASRPAALATLALAALIAACNANTGATTQPTTQVSTPPASQPPTAAPTPAGPTPTPSPSPTPTFGEGQISHPTGATDIVLRMETGGGFVPMGFMLTQAPTFTLYGDGTVIFQPIDTRENAGPFGSQAYLPWQVGHLTEESVQALLQFALSTGRLANARENYDNPMIADAGTTTFNLNAGGQQKVVSIYGLFEMPDASGPDAVDRAGFAKLQAALIDFQNQEGLGDVSDYDAAFYRVILVDGFGEPVNEPGEWPWSDMTLDDFPPQGDEAGRILNLDKEHVSKLLETPNGGHPGVWVTAPDEETLVMFGVRPLLPDEIEASGLL